MARTRACKARPRPPGRVLRMEKEETRRGSTVEELRLEDEEDERETGGGGYGKRWAQCSIGKSLQHYEEDFFNLTVAFFGTIEKDDGRDVELEIKKEDDNEEMAKEEENTTPTVQHPKKRPRTRTRVITQLSPSPSPPLSKKRKTTPPPARITRSTTKTKRKVSAIEPDSASDSDSDSKSGSSSSSESESSSPSGEEDKQQTTHIPHTPSPFLPVSLLRPYLSFQLSLSNLSGPQYTKAERSMKAVLDAVSSLEASTSHKKCRSKPTSGDDVKGGRGCERERGSRKKGREDDVLPRKCRELKEQTRRRLLEEEGKRVGLSTFPIRFHSYHLV